MIAPIDVTDIRIETERLLLRPWKESDLDDLYEYASVPGVGEMAGWCHHKSIEESEQILKMFIDGKKTLALELKCDGKVIGSVGIEDIEPEFDLQHKAGREIGYVLSRDYWGRGLMPEAVKAVIDYCFTELDMDYLTCGHFIQNHQSRRVIEKCGFEYVMDTVRSTRYDTRENMKLYVLYNPNREVNYV